MKKLPLLLLLFFLSIHSSLVYAKSEQCIGSLHVQDRSGVVYLPNHEKPYTGEYYCAYPTNGQYKTKGSYLKGKKHGTWTSWYENGQKQAQFTFKSGKQYGVVLGWHKNGVKEVETELDNFIKDGLQIMWNADGQKTAELYFSNGLASGTSRLWHENGQQKIEINHVEGVKHGQVLEWYESGQKKNRETYINGNLDGVTTSWYENGQIQSEILYLYGLISTQKIWYSSGQIESERQFKENKLNGNFRSWHDNGQLSMEGSFVSGKKEGNWTWWHSSGEINKEEKYTNGNRIIDQRERDKIALELIEKDQFSRSYIGLIAARVKDQWRYMGAEDDWGCDVYIIQDEDGYVEAVNVQDCTVDDSYQATSFKNSIERAVYKSSPLPLAPDQSVFDTEIMFHFRAN